jgi:hypothetical protein
VHAFSERVVRSSGDGSHVLFATLDESTLVVRATDTLTEIAPAFASLGADTSQGSVENIYTLDWEGRRVAGTNSAGHTVVWTLAGGTFVPYHELTPPGGVQPTRTIALKGLAFSPDGAHVALKTIDQRLIVWDLEHPENPRVKLLPGDAMARVTYSPDGDLIAVDGTYLFSAATLDQIGPRLRPTEWSDPILDAGTQATQFVTTPDGGLLLMVERLYDIGAAQWRIDPAALTERACALAGRNLTREEFDLYEIGGEYRAAPCAGRPIE